VIQARGRKNRDPYGSELSMLRIWAEENGVTIP
jgi:hypothetical protein